MPLYEYQCQSCGRRTEILQRLSDPAVTECSVCGGAQKRLVSAPAVQFKGSGWYVTDYAKKSGGGTAKASEGGESAKSDGGGESVAKVEAGGDSKAEAKKDSPAPSPTPSA
jgi:putative FmdB family regulatory protein